MVPWNREANTYKNEWQEVMFIIDKDIAEYLERRYEDYYKDKNEKSSTSGGEAQRERHKVKQNQLVKFGIKLKEKLNFFQNESRKELFKQIDLKNKQLDSFFKKIYDDFCKELDKTNKALLLYEQKDPYTLHCEKSDKEEQLLEYKEIMKNSCFVEKIDKRRADYEKKKADRDKRRVEEEKRKAEEKIKEERTERRKGLSNVKPLSFYEEMYIYGDDDEDEERIKSEQEHDNYFEENGIPERYDCRISDKRPEAYTSADTPEENQKYLDRCKEIANILVNLRDSEYNQLQLLEVGILQKYLTKGYLITRQIAWFVYFLNELLIEELSIDPNNPNIHIKNHPSKEYDVGIYRDDFDIIKIKGDVDEFVRENEGTVLTPIEYLKVFLKKHDNRITVVRYASIINQSYKVSLRILKGYVADKNLKCKKVGKSHKLIFLI